MANIWSCPECSFLLLAALKVSNLVRVCTGGLCILGQWSPKWVLCMLSHDVNLLQLGKHSIFFITRKFMQRKVSVLTSSVVGFCLFVHYLVKELWEISTAKIINEFSPISKVEKVLI